MIARHRCEGSLSPPSMVVVVTDRRGICGACQKMQDLDDAGRVVEHERDDVQGLLR